MHDLRKELEQVLDVRPPYPTLGPRGGGVHSSVTGGREQVLDTHPCTHSGSGGLTGGEDGPCIGTSTWASRRRGADGTTLLRPTFLVRGRPRPTPTSPRTRPGTPPSGRRTLSGTRRGLDGEPLDPDVTGTGFGPYKGSSRLCLHSPLLTTYPKAPSGRKTRDSE